jgi:hypothetical protein
MRGLNNRSFFARWQVLYARSNPGLTKDRWEVDGCDWSKERHSYWGKHYSYQFEVHRLQRQSRGKSDWVLLVIIERWWGEDRTKCVRESYWCRADASKSDAILAWFRRQE